MSDKLLNVKVIVGGRPYTLNVSKESETLVRSAAKQINGEISSYKKQFRMKDEQDYIAMVSLMNTVQMLKSTSENTSKSTSLEDKLQELDSEILSIEQEIR